MYEDLLRQAAEADPWDPQNVCEKMKHKKTGFPTGLLLKQYCSAII